MPIAIRTEGEFKYVECGEGPVLMALHGLFGALSNFRELINGFKDRYKVVIPILPLYELPLKQTTVPGFADYIERFVKFKKYGKTILLGNSLGGHIALIYALRNLNKISAIVLTGSSGLFESALGDTYPKRGDYDFIREKTKLTFYDPKNATKELVDEVYNIVNDRDKTLRVISTARSAIHSNLAEEIKKLFVPSLVLWGKNDTITPPFVAEEFHKLLPDSELVYIDKCGHAAMMERPKEFNTAVTSFLNRINGEV